MGAQENDEGRFRSLEACITRLRVKYQQCGFDLTATAKRFRAVQEGQFTHRELPRFLHEAKTIDADFGAIPRELLNFAAIHGARLHWSLLDGSCFGAAEELDHAISTYREPGSVDLVRYLCEKVVRLLDSAVHLINFDISQLSKGYLSSGKVDFKLLESSDLLLAMTYNGSLIQLFGRTQGLLREMGRYVARKISLRRPILWSDETQKTAMFAVGGPYLYRWDLHSSTPAAEFDSGGNSMVNFDIFSRGSLGTEVVAYAYARGCWLLDPISLKMRETLDDSAPWDAGCRALWWDNNDARYHGVFKGSATTTSIWSCQLGGDGSCTGRADLKKVLETLYSDLLGGGTSDGDTRLEVDQVISVQLEQIKGTRCVVVCVQLWSKADQRFSDALVFLDPYKLQPIRAPIITRQETARFRMVPNQNKSLMVATLRRHGDSWNSASAFAVWDVSNFSDRRSLAPLNQWPQDRFDSHNLCLANRDRDERWDAYFTVSNKEHGHPGPSEVRRLDGLTGGSERVLEFPEQTFEMSILRHVPSLPAKKSGSILVYAEGKTDYLHLQAALSHFHAKGFYTQLALDFADSMGITNDDQLLKQCMALALAPLAQTVVCMFDCDVPQMIRKVSGEGSVIKRWGDRVFSFAIPIPKHRVAESGICIEMYYQDHEIGRADADGRRLFLRKEFNDKGFHQSGLFICKDRDRRSLVVDSNVYDVHSQQSVALSKAAFAQYVKDQVTPFDQIDFEPFREIFDVFVTILQREPDLA